MVFHDMLLPTFGWAFSMRKIAVPAKPAAFMSTFGTACLTLRAEAVAGPQFEHRSKSHDSRRRARALLGSARARSRPLRLCGAVSVLRGGRVLLPHGRAQFGPFGLCDVRPAP